MSQTFAATEKFVSLSGRLADGGAIRLHYRDWGGSGQALVPLHGLSSSCRIWDFTAPLLTPHFRVLALDQRGHGLSDKTATHTFDDVTGDLAAFVEALALDQPVIVGHSWGACVALEFAARLPEAVAAIALIDGGFLERGAGDTPWEQAEKMMMPPALDGVPVEGLLRAAKGFPDFAALWSDQLQEMFLSNFEIRDAKVYRRLPIPEHMEIAKEIWEQRPSQLWPRLRCPVLIVPAIKESGDPQRELWMQAKIRGIELAKRALPNATVVRMEDTIHDVPIQRPRELAEAIIAFAAESKP